MSDSPTEVLPATPDLTREYTDSASREQRLAKMLDIEDTVLQRALANVEAVQSFSEISPNEENPPEHWVQQYGLEGAQKKLELAKQGWRPMKDAPFGAVQAMQIVVGIAKARGQKVHLTTSELNVKISLPAPTTAEHPGAVVYETRELDE